MTTSTMPEKPPTKPVSDSTDLLGLGFDEPEVIVLPTERPHHFAPAPSPTVAPASTIAAAVAPRSMPIPKLDEPVIAYPPAWQNPGTDFRDAPLTAGYSVKISGSMPELARERPQAVEQGSKLEPWQKLFTARCEGRWRVRSAPSLNSRVIGTISNGTLVIGTECLGEAALEAGGINDFFSSLAPPKQPTRAGGVEVGGTANGSAISTLWVKVDRFEAQELMGVSEIKRDAASGGALYCLRRNALGYGLYLSGVEPIDGPLLTLPEKLSAELRSDAQRAAADKSEDVSLTWKLLGAAESVGRFFSQMGTGSIADEGGIQEDMKPQRRRPEDVFEVKQREHLKKAATALRMATEKLINKAEVATTEDLTAGMPKEIGRRFARLRINLAKQAGASRLVLLPGQTSAPAPSDDSSFVEGSVQDLKRFDEHLARVEKTGGWPELSNDLRQEVTNFSAKHSRDLENHARAIGKVPVTVTERPSTENPSQPTSPTSGGGANTFMQDELLGDFVAPVPAKPTNAFALPFLPPPPPPASGVSTAKLI